MWRVAIIMAHKPNPGDEVSPQELAQALLEDYNSLKSISPEHAVEKYVESRDKISKNTRSEYERKLGYFLDYCEKIELEDLNELGGREIDGFEKWRRNESSDKVDSLSNNTMRDDLYLFRGFLTYLEKIEGVPRRIAEKVDIPKLDDGEGIRDVELAIKRLKRILEHLEKYNYASREHVEIAIVAECGRRLGGVHSLDLEDAHLDGSRPYLQFSHHNDGRTRLKNEEKGEEQVNISTDLAGLLKDYIKTNRVEKAIDGRKPLITTSNGRVGKSTVRSDFYSWTRPCKIDEECPEGRNPAECNAASCKNNASKCPASEAPHAARHGYLTEMLRKGVPKEILSDRCDITREILIEHYDERTPEEKRDERWDELKDKGAI